MMNQNNFPNMGGARPQQANHHVGGMQRNGGGTSSDIQSVIQNILMREPPPPGWQQTIPPKMRVGFIHQMVTGLQIVKPGMAMEHAINVATNFEMQQFTNCLNRESYVEAHRAKLAEIQKTRQNQANMHQQQFQNLQQAQMGLTQPQMHARAMMNNQNAFQPGFGMAQGQQPGQTVAAPMQQQLSQNLHQFPNGNPPGMQQPMQSGQPMQNVPRPNFQTRGQPQFTPGESSQIQGIAMQLMARMTDQDKLSMRQRLSQLSAEQRQAMQSNGIDPLQAMIRNQAVQTFITERNRKRQLAGQGVSIPPHVATPPQARPASQVSLHGQQQPQPNPTMQHPNPALSAGDNQFVGQQQDAIRLQAAGQDVVPASNGQGTPAQIRGTPHQLPQGQPVSNRVQPGNPFQPQPSSQPGWNGAQNPQPNMSQSTSIPMQTSNSNSTNRQTQPPQQQALHGQLGGLNNNRGQRTPQQNHNMPTLNRPMDPPNQTKNERPPQQTPKQGQRSGLISQANTGTNEQSNVGQQKPQIMSTMQAQFAKLPLKVQQQVQKLPEEGQKQFMMRFQRQQQQHLQNKAAAEARAAQMPQHTAQATAQGTAPSAKVSQTNNAPPVPPNSTGGPPPGSNPFGRVNNTQAQGPQQLGPSEGARPPPMKGLQIQLSEDQRQKMDNQQFPPAILNKNNSLGQLPDSVKSWHQLKEYVRQNAHSLDPKVPQMVNNLQSMHFQQLVHESRRRQQQQQMNQVTQAQMQPAPGGPAPQAPMMPQQPIQTPVTQPPVPFTAGHGFVAPNIPQPTVAELQHVRANLPDQMKGFSDAQLRQMIMQRRQAEVSKANQLKFNSAQQLQQRNNLLQAQRQQGQLPIGQAQSAQTQQPGRTQAQPAQQGFQHHPSQSQQASKQQSQTNGPGRQTQSTKPSAPNVPSANQKGPKRNGSDDVIEVPDPKSVSQQARPATGMPQMASDAYANLSAEQRAEIGHRMQAQAAQRANMGNSGPSASPAHQNAGKITGKDGRLNRLIQEVAQTMAPRAVVPMSPKTRSHMIEKLTDKSTRGLVLRIEQSLPVFLDKTQDEKQTKDLLRIRLLLLRQVQGSDFNVPVENFTISVEELDNYKAHFHKYFNFMVQTVQNASQSTGGAPQLPPGQPQQLNVANLQQHQAQQHQATLNAARVATSQKTQANNNQKSNNMGNDNNKAPAAPTSSHAPQNPFGTASPQHVPQAYPTHNALTRDKLKLPPGKKRKPNQAPATTQPMDTVKVESPEAPRAPVVPSMMKCAVPDCETGKMGFATKEDLEKHRVEVHGPKEPVIKDPLDAAAYAIESMRLALNLDENGKSKPVTQGSNPDKATLQAPSMKTSASSQGQSLVKHEAATPMSRIPTQTGPSPSSNLLKTPQATANVKTPASEAKSASKAPIVGKDSEAVKPDPWANSLVKPEWFQEVFSGVAHLNHPVPQEIITGWMERNPLTPPTSPSSGEPDKDSPNKSDISANDDLNINVSTDMDDWIMFDNELPDDMEALDVADLMEMDWDTAFGQPEEEGKALGKGKRRRDPMEPSDEWLKAWAPEKYEENKKRDAQRKR